MYFDITTTRTEPQLPFDSYDIREKQHVWQMRHSSIKIMALQSVIICVAIIIFASSTSGFHFGVLLTNQNDITIGMENLPTSSAAEKETLPLREVDSDTTTTTAIAPLTDAENELSEKDRKHYSAIFQHWNLSENEYENKACEHNMDHELCPADASVSCGSMGKIEQFCKALIIGDNSHAAVRTTESTNALEGCKIYVSWNHGSCCHSTFCENEYGDDNNDDEEEPEF